MAGPREPAGAVTQAEETGLTARRTEVLRLLASGCSNTDIAAALHLSPKTVMHYTSNLYRKLEVRGRAEAVTAVWRRGLLGDAT
jgi:DNA-binding NarL/FixJ family response regulator